MAIRTTEDAVKGIIDVDDEIDLTPFIETANNIVEQVCLDAGYSDTTLELIERWLSAHLYATRDPRTEREEVKGILEAFEGSTKPGLQNTRYGQQVMLIDTAGTLTAIDATASGVRAVKTQIVHIGGMGECY